MSTCKASRADQRLDGRERRHGDAMDGHHADGTRDRIGAVYARSRDASRVGPVARGTDRRQCRQSDDRRSAREVSTPSATPPAFDRLFSYNGPLTALDNGTVPSALDTAFHGVSIALSAPDVWTVTAIAMGHHRPGLRNVLRGHCHERAGSRRASLPRCRDAALSADLRGAFVRWRRDPRRRARRRRDSARTARMDRATDPGACRRR